MAHPLLTIRGGQGAVRALGYIRQSRRADLDCAVCGEPDDSKHSADHPFRPVALSPTQQRETIEKLAARDGLEPSAVSIYEDLGRSGGRGKETKRAGYQALLTELKEAEPGRISALYTKSLTRLARSVPELYRLSKLLEDKRVRLVTEKEGSMDPTTPLGGAQFGMMAVMAEFERALSVERARDNVSSRRARGERMGRQPYGSKPGESPDIVVAAYRETRSLNAAAQQLNRQRIKSPLGRLWSGTGVRLVVQRHAPELLPTRTTRGVKPSSPFLLFRLLKCHCGRLMTASRDLRRPNKQVVYRCHAASVIPDHGPYRVTEGDVLPWIQGEAEHWHRPDETAELQAANAGRRAALQDERERVGLAFTRRAISLEAMESRHAEIDDEIAALADAEEAGAIPERIPWDRPDDVTNAALRALWEYVQLGPDMRPVEAVWRVKEWRRD